MLQKRLKKQKQNFDFNKAYKLVKENSVCIWKIYDPLQNHKHYISELKLVKSVAEGKTKESVLPESRGEKIWK